MKKICVVTGTRADYGLLRWVMQGIADSPVCQLQLIATGMHLSHEFGLTYRAIEADGFHIDRKVEMLLGSDTAVGITKSMGLALCGFADALAELSPDMLLVLGDRFEIFAACASAMIAGMPIAHIHGGEVTEGAIDEAIRHSITKMSHLHFVAAEEYRQRVIQLGEAEERVFLVGGLGVDSILKLQLLGKRDLEAALEFPLGKRNLLVTYHPVTLERGAAVREMTELLSALEALEETHIIFTMPNADAEGQVLFDMIGDFVRLHPDKAKSFVSLGQLRYLSCLKHVDGVVGNSSSGLLEAPSFRIGTVNVGDRQQGRVRAASVIDCQPNRLDIARALNVLLSDAFRAQVVSVANPYGGGGASEAIVKILEEMPFEGLRRKHFCDLTRR